MSRPLSVVRRVAHALPMGVELGKAEWEHRHRWIVRLLVLHVPVVIVFGIVRGFPIAHAVGEALPVAGLAVLASLPALARRTRAVSAGLGLMVSSAVLVHLAGGATEMHFHFFVMLSVIALYQDWRPFLVSIGFVAAHHALMGAITPHDVFDHRSAWNNPLTWAGIHAFFVLASCALSVVSWGIVEDDHRRSQAALEESERRFRALIEHSTDVITVIGIDLTITYDSPSAVSVLGYQAADRIGRNGFDFIHPDDHEHTAAAIDKLLDHPGSQCGLELRARHRDGGYRWLDVSIANLLDEPAINGLVANFRDITERKELEDQLAHQAFHDPLTALPNRALLLDRVEHARITSARTPGKDRELALIYVDLDDFKTVNDGLGHEAGDELLRQAAARISGVLRPGDTAARLGGDEFAVLAEHLPNPGMAYEIGARILEAVGEPFAIAGNSVVVNASVGIAVSDGSDDAAALLRNADLAMYQAKSGGKGRFAVFEAGMHAAVVERMALKADLRRAVDAGEFEPHYQPIVDLPTGRVIGTEALARWHHPERGLIPPIEFIPLAEETGLIVRIGGSILRRACEDAASWARAIGAGAPHVSVNLSVRQIQDPGLVDEVAAALRSSGLAPSSLVLEITESILLEDTEAAATTLAKLKALGVSIALDDFGTGYSSLSYLSRFPVDIVKIDKSFVDGLAGPEGSPLVSAIVNLSSLLGLAVTAEGVETADQVERLRAMGCGNGQGYVFAAPMPAEQMSAHLAHTPV